MRGGAARPDDRHGRPERPVRGDWRRQGGAVSGRRRPAAEARRRRAAAARQGARRQLQGRLRQVSRSVDASRPPPVSKGALQDRCLRLLGGLYRLGQPDGCGHWHEGRRQPQLRGRHTHRRACAGGCSRRPFRLGVARPPLQDLQAQGFLRRPDKVIGSGILFFSKENKGVKPHGLNAVYPFGFMNVLVQLFTLFRCDRYQSPVPTGTEINLS